MMADFSDSKTHCLNCGDLFIYSESQKRYNRTPIDTEFKLRKKSVTPRDCFAAISINITPNKNPQYLCTPCTKQVQTLAKLNTQREKLLQEEMEIRHRVLEVTESIADICQNNYLQTKFSLQKRSADHLTPAKGVTKLSRPEGTTPKKINLMSRKSLLCDKLTHKVSDQNEDIGVVPLSKMDQVCQSSSVFMTPFTPNAHTNTSSVDTLATPQATPPSSVFMTPVSDPNEDISVDPLNITSPVSHSSSVFMTPFTPNTLPRTFIC